MGKGKEGAGKGKRGRGREGGKGRTPVPDCESAKVATLKCGSPPTMPEENRGPWSTKFENRCYMSRCLMNVIKVICKNNARPCVKKRMSFCACAKSRDLLKMSKCLIAFVLVDVDL